MGNVSLRRSAASSRSKFPYANALAEYLLVTLPPWLPAGDAFDNWQTSAWERMSIRKLSEATQASHRDERF